MTESGKTGQQLAAERLIATAGLKGMEEDPETSEVLNILAMAAADSEDFHTEPQEGVEYITLTNEDIPPDGFQALAVASTIVAAVSHTLQRDLRQGDGISFYTHLQEGSGAIQRVADLLAVTFKGATLLKGMALEAEQSDTEVEDDQSGN
jgi:hypothetical protein